MHIKVLLYYLVYRALKCAEKYNLVKRNLMILVFEELIISVASNSNITNFEPLWTWQIILWTHSNPGSSTKIELRTPSKSSKFEPVQPEIGQTLIQIWKNRTSNPYEPRIIYQNRTYEPSKNPKPMNCIRPNMLQHYSFVHTMISHGRIP